MKNYDLEIKKREDEIANLKAEKSKKFDSLTEPQIIATMIHDGVCTWNHTDGCGWFYEKWDNIGYSKKVYLEKANNILKEVDFESAYNTLKHI